MFLSAASTLALHLSASICTGAVLAQAAGRRALSSQAQTLHHMSVAMTGTRQASDVLHMQAWLLKISWAPNHAGLEALPLPPSVASFTLGHPAQPLTCLQQLFIRLAGTAAAEADGSQPRPPTRIPLPQAHTAPGAAVPAAAAAGFHAALPDPVQPEGAEPPQVLNGTATAGLAATDLHTRLASISSCQP